VLNPSKLTTTGLIAAVTDRRLPEDYRDACVTELAARIDHPESATRPVAAHEVVGAAGTVAA
jgi:hypothetical protein